MLCARPRSHRPHALAVAAALLASGCPIATTPGTVRGEIGAAGGALSLEGAVLVVPPGAVTGPTRFSITRLAEPPPGSAADRALTPLYSFEPSDLDLAVPARVTLPASAFSTAPMLRWSLPGSTTEFEDVLPLFSSSVAYTSERTRLGRVFAESRGSGAHDAGMPDAGRPDAGRPDAGRPDAGAPDAARIDAPTFDAGPPPPPSVTVGADLRPADFSCRGTRTAPPVGATPGPAPVLVRELLDGGGRATFFASSDALGALGTGSTDSTGAGVVVARDGTWTTLSFELTAGASDTLTIPPQSAHFLSFTPSASTRVEVLSQRTWQLASTTLSPFGERGGVLVGTVTDCSGAPVAGARARVFTSLGELDPRTGGRFGLGYSSGASRTPSASATRTSVDGTFFAVGALDPASLAATEVRVEVWGSLAFGAPEERLGCEQVASREDGPVSLSIGPMRADGRAGCL